MTASISSDVRFRLVGEVGDRGLVHLLAEGENGVGSGEDNAVVLAARGVSRHHALITLGADGVTVEDLGSKNGTFVNGVRITRARLKQDDWVHFGEALLTLETIAPADAELAVPLSEPGAGGAGAPGLADGSTELACGGDAPAAWAETLCRACALALAPEPDPGAVLATLAAETGAATVALLVPGGRGGPVVRHLAGAGLDPEVVRALGRAAGRAGIEHGFATRAGLAPAFAAALHLCEGRWDAVLVAAGETVAPELAPVLEILLRVIRHAGGESDPAGEAPACSAAPGLVVPEGDVLCPSAAMADVYHQLRGLAGGDIPVLVTGETGVGKEHVARILHASSRRADAPFQVVNCAAIPAELLEAELFGIEAGVATGVSARPGKIRLAHGGTVFLDEVADMAPRLQAKLLRTLQDGEVHPVGASAPVPTDVRLVAATNADLAARVTDGGFRADLYYRLAACVVHVPPLRERPEDIAPLIERFLGQAAAETGKSLRGLTVAAMRVLQDAAWPGNVRELSNEVRRLVHLCPQGRAVEASMVSAGIRGRDQAAGGLAEDDDLDLKRRVKALERHLVRRALTESDRNLTRAAELLGITRNGLVMKMQPCLSGCCPNGMPASREPCGMEQLVSFVVAPAGPRYPETVFAEGAVREVQGVAEMPDNAEEMRRSGELGVIRTGMDATSGHQAVGAPARPPRRPPGRSPAWSEYTASQTGTAHAP